jgi:hypothetical protein
MTGNDTRRVLRWVFIRDHQQLTCEVALDAQAFLYEFSVVRGSQLASRSIDRFRDAPQAFERQCQFEAVLIDDGWTLAAYESDTVAFAAS